jgi:hypothetical protein
MSDTKWLLRQGFVTCEKLTSGFSLLVKKINSEAINPKFNSSVISGACNDKDGIVVYYTNRCPFSAYHVTNSMVFTTEKRKIPLKIIKLDTSEEARKAPTPATIFSMFYNGKFITTDLSVCLDSRFDMILEKGTKQS